MKYIIQFKTSNENIQMMLIQFVEKFLETNKSQLFLLPMIASGLKYSCSHSTCLKILDMFKKYSFLSFN